jgi:hypothetical protein
LHGLPDTFFWPVVEGFAFDGPIVGVVVADRFEAGALALDMTISSLSLPDRADFEIEYTQRVW